MDRLPHLLVREREHRARIGLGREDAGVVREAEPVEDPRRVRGGIGDEVLVDERLVGKRERLERLG